ncbi:MAG: TonB-dependent receptor [Paludibacter sp.]
MKNTAKRKLLKCKLRKYIVILIVILAQGIINGVEAQTTNLTIQNKNVTVKEVIAFIEENSQIIFFYADKDVDLTRKVSIDVKNQPVSTILEELFKNSSNNFKIDGNQVYILKKLKPEDNNSKLQEQKKNKIAGLIVDENNQPIIGANIMLDGTRNGTISDMNGNFSIEAPENAKLKISYIGYEPQLIDTKGKTLLKISLSQSLKNLNEVVVIGYGSVKKKDITGSVTQVSEKEFQKGVTTPERMILGKVAGVQITPNGGLPGGGSRIRIRGGASLTASNDPLIIIDGVPIENSSVSGSPSSLSTINPNDIESMNILKDASAAAIYGSRASNGVIIITTKQAKLGQKTKVEFNTRQSVSTITNKLDVLSAAQIRDIVTNHPFSNDEYRGMLGNSSTDWQNEVYQAALGTDNTLTLSGTTPNMPYRVSFGYLNEDGILKGGNMERLTTNINLNPRYFDNELKINISLKGSSVKSKFANTGAIEASMGFDPTQPVKADGFDKYEGYFTCLLADGSVNTQSFPNPVSLLDTYDNTAQILRGIASSQIDYIMHFFPDLRANLNLSYDYAQGYGNVSSPAWAAYSYTRGGQNTDYGSFKSNELLEFYLNYSKKLTSIKSSIDVTAGYTYQDWMTHTEHFQDYTADGKPYGTPQNYPYDESQHTLISFFGRLNYSLSDKYLLTASIRRDGSSRFSPNSRWGNFPSVALAWHMSEEDFLKDSKVISDMKIRLGYGKTGQQDIGLDYGYIPYYTQSSTKTQYQFGDQYYYMNRPQAYDEGLKWETTTTYNAALDYGLFDNRITGSVDLYLKRTNDLLNRIQIAAGTNFSDRLLTNVGALENRGIEFSVNAVPVQSKTVNWDISFNLAYNKNEITKLTAFDNPDYKGSAANLYQMQSVGYPLNSFFLFTQVYNKAGKPLEGVYADYDNNGAINDNDKKHIKSSDPSIIAGFSTNLSYRNWTLSTVIRGSYDNYVYNGIDAIYATYGTLFSASRSIVNVPTNVLRTNFYYQQQYSDYYLGNASFIKMDNVTLTHNLDRLFSNSFHINATFNVQNVFTITKYSGTDPEIANGIDRSFYPYPRIYALGLNFLF